MRPFKRYVTSIFHPIEVRHPLSILLSSTSPMLFTKVHKETIEWEERSFRYVAAYHVISKQVRNNILDTCCINNPDWQSSVITFLCKYNIVVSDTLVGSFLDVLFLLFAVILSGFHEKPSRNRDWITEKNTYKNLCEGHDVLDGTSCFLCDFFAFLVYSLPHLKWHTCWVAPIKIHNIAMGCNVCDDIMSEGLKIWKPVAI